MMLAITVALILSVLFLTLPALMHNGGAGLTALPQRNPNPRTTPAGQHTRQTRKASRIVIAGDPFRWPRRPALHMVMIVGSIMGLEQRQRRYSRPELNGYWASGIPPPLTPSSASPTGLRESGGSVFIDHFCAIRYTFAARFDASGSSSVGRTLPCQGRGRRFKSDLPLQKTPHVRGVFSFGIDKVVFLT